MKPHKLHTQTSTDYILYIIPELWLKRGINWIVLLLVLIQHLGFGTNVANIVFQSIIFKDFFIV